MSEWLPIATAPKDGTHILVYPALAAFPLVVSWERPARTPPMMRARGEETGHFGFWRVAMSQAKVPYDPTHWMPCPSPPLSPTEEPALPPQAEAAQDSQPQE